MKKNRMLNMISILLTLIFLFTFGSFSYFLFKIDIVPTKYLLYGFGVIGLVFLLLLSFLFSRKKKILKALAMLIIAVFSCFSFLGTKYIANTYSFFKGTSKDFDTITYSVIVLKESNLNKIKDLNEKNISYLEDHYEDDIKKELESKISYTEIRSNEFGTILDHLLAKETDAIVLEESYYNLACEEIEDFENTIKIIYTFEVCVKTYEEEEKEINVTLEPFILYISGIDSYGKISNVRGRSDVNQLVIVNPKTKRVLLLNTPRDYYVQLAGTTGLKDKLTHAGIYGVEKSIKTLENLYDIDIQYYLRVNFNTLIQVVDVIGGIDVYSDKAFTPYTNKSVYIEEGMNHFNGAMALAYARERYTYTTGDHHRGANQQQVIEAIIDKVTSSNILISKYNSILNSLDGTFQTDIPMSEITSFIKYQLNEMPTWKIESYAVTGSGSKNYTYSMGTKYLLYVMIPNLNSVNTAKTKIKEVLHEK